MEHPLDDSRDKVERAMEQFDTLHGEMGQFVQDHPDIAVQSFDPQTGEDVFEVDVSAPPPKRWGHLAAEIAYNLRGALDYLVYELAVEGGGQPERDKTAFPIAIDRGEYWNPRGKRPCYRDQCLVGVDEEWRLEIDELQPYNRVQFPQDHPLARLNRLSNRDKHRKPVPVYISFVTARLVITPKGKKGSVGKIEVRIGQNGKIDMRAYLPHGIPTRNLPGMADREIAEITEKAQPDDERGLSFSIGDGPMISIHDFRDVIEYIGFVLRRFEPALEPPAE